MRILSLSPPAAAWLAAFGGTDAPVTASPERVPGRSGADLVLLSGDPAVDAAAPDAVPNIVFAPQTFKQVLDLALGLGRASGHFREAMQVVGEGERRLHRLRDLVGVERRADASRRPRVACLQLTSGPGRTGLYRAGGWTGQLVEHAGGLLVPGGGPSEEGGPAGQPAGGERTAPVSSRDVALEAPDYLFFAAPGVSLAAGREAVRRQLGAEDGWNTLPAVSGGRAYVMGGPNSFATPGPGLFRAAELIAAVLHPERVRAVVVPEEDEVVPLSEP